MMQQKIEERLGGETWPEREKEITYYSNQSCQDLGNFLRSFIAFNFSNQHLSSYTFPELVVQFAPRSPTRAEVNEALVVYSIFQQKKCGDSKEELMNSTRNTFATN